NTQKAFDKYFIESSKPMDIYECINKKCFTNNFTNSLGSGLSLIIIYPKNCNSCKEGYDKEVLPILNNIETAKIITVNDIGESQMFVDNHFRFEHATSIVMDRYNVHYVFEYHPEMPFKANRMKSFFS